jgi:hypothetical protein
MVPLDPVQKPLLLTLGVRLRNHDGTDDAHSSKCSFLGMTPHCLIALSDGSIERLRCRAAYRVDGSEKGLQQSLRCASDSYKFDLSSDLVNQGGRISGTWSESSRGISGSLEGRVGGGRITALVESAGFSANIRVTTVGLNQSVSIVSQGDIRQVSISMVRR